MDIKNGEFVAVIGKVGSGKSSLLNSVMGMLSETGGYIKKNGRLGFVPQNSFLLNMSLRDNILFGLPYEVEKYRKILKICELIPDLKMLPAGDHTEIGERGINLSGGQKQRISIARIIYSDPDILLVDDALSALDANVGKKIFYNVFKDYAKDKTRLMTTHALQYIEEVDRIVFMEDGQIIEQGTYEKLMNNEKFRLFLSKQKEIEEEENEQKEIDAIMSERTLKGELTSQQSLLSNMQSTKAKLLMEEKRFRGTIGFDLYVNYFSHGGILYFFISMILVAVSVGLRIFVDYFIGSWIRNEYGLDYSTYVKILFGLAGATAVVIILRGYQQSHFLALVAFNIFRKFMARLFKKNMEFFDTTPSGQILNLVTKDTDYMDVALGGSFSAFFALLFQLIGTFIIVAIGNWIVIPFILLMIIIFIWVIKYFL